MKTESKLKVIKFIHTLVWVFFNVVIFFMLYSVLIDHLDKWLWIGYAIVLMECIILLIYKFKCPLTYIARKYSDSSLDNFDIYLPNWLARNNKTIYSIILILIILITFYRLLT